ncbi:MAG: glycosyltransferase [Candidatus Scalindua sp. AMX11]|nr:MAG: glycosyltransferase [Candidatus Scalindua sp.]NOG83373.1 glycosyltransferase [Planctomycetota bacterium]RZV65537.1 MAG: glycosyltransferase [Candidatus Scalindua sp. SCAELEC01]TDE63522.1 MAG: glycosyltransferase [Candidatus Scalindua sp. AMX11]
MDKLLLILLLIVYCPAALWLFLYGMNSYYMIYLFLKKFRKEGSQNEEFIERFWITHTVDKLPKVTTQLPIYNERHVIGRLIEAAVNIDYPKDLHEIQLLDDSTDETRGIAANLVNKYREMGFNIRHIVRGNRSGFKAGALNVGLNEAEGEFLAIFDADFVPDKYFLLETIPFFYQKERVALVQTRWGHINRNYSLLTIAQSLGMDGHFIIEQGARTWNGLYMNFNGTAGIWRKEAIVDAGGWHFDTLTEDLDLSYRAQLKGWNTKFLFDVVTPSELPVDINAYKSQQHRWAKGSIQTAKKVLPEVFRTDDTLIKKIEAFIHLNQYMVHPMMVILALFSLPLIMVLKPSITSTSVTMLSILCLIFMGAFAPSFLYIVSQKMGYKDWCKRCLFIPALMFIGCGVAVNNTKAVVEAFLNKKSDFVRTPKYGVVKRGKRTREKGYKLPMKLFFISEIVLSLYCFMGFMQYTNNKRLILGPFLLMYAMGFLYVGALSLLHNFKGSVKC